MVAPAEIADRPVGLVVVKLSALVAVVPLRIAIACRADAVAGKLAAPDLRERGPVPFRFRLVEQWPEADTG